MSNNPYFIPTESGYDGYEKDVTEIVHGVLDGIPEIDDPDQWDMVVEQVLYWHPAIDFDDDYYPCSQFLISAVEAY